MYHIVYVFSVYHIRKSNITANMDIGFESIGFMKSANKSFQLEKYNTQSWCGRYPRLGPDPLCALLLRGIASVVLRQLIFNIINLSKF